MSKFTLSGAVTVAVCVLASACGGSNVGSGGGAAGAGAAAGKGSGGASSGDSGGDGGGSSPIDNPGAGQSQGGASSGGASSGGASSGGAGGAPVQTCEAITPCGGDLVGTWQVQKYCSPTSVPGSSSAGLCPGTTLDITPPTLTGTITFNVDKTMSTVTSLSFDETANFPPSCYTEAQCMTFEMGLASQKNVSNAKCSYAAASGCSCTLHYGGPQSSTGTYEVSGTSVTITNGTSKAETDSFCVSGSTLSVESTGATRSTIILGKM